MDNTKKGEARSAGGGGGGLIAYFVRCLVSGCGHSNCLSFCSSIVERVSVSCRWSAVLLGCFCSGFFPPHSCTSMGSIVVIVH